MGSGFGPDYANLFMGNMEHFSVFNNNPHSEHILLYICYIDYCFLLWRAPLSKLDQFVSHLNNMPPTIKFIVEQCFSKC